ncbi:MAG: hypothetical protein ACREH3_01560, partial [Geminicoccales bacterium]
MKLLKADETKYPKLYKFVKDELPEVVKNPKIVKAMKKYGEIGKLGLRIVLIYGLPPTVKVATLPDACGEFTPSDKAKSNEIRISKALVEKFEKDTKKYNKLVEATLLHELAHWGDNIDGKDLPGEEGEKFEKEAYGHVVPCVL